MFTVYAVYGVLKSIIGLQITCQDKLACYAIVILYPGFLPRSNLVAMEISQTAARLSLPGSLSTRLM